MLLVNKLKMKDIRYVLEKYNMRKGEQERICSFAKSHRKLFRYLSKAKLKPSQIFSILEPLSYEVIILIMAMSSKKIIKKRVEDFLSLYDGTRLHISGKDLVKLGIKPGAHFKDALKKTLYAKIDGKVKAKPDELRFIKKLMGCQ